MSIELKIKGLSLAQEARIIRNYERKLRKMKQVKVRHRRRGDVDANGDPVPRTELIVQEGYPAGWKKWGESKVRSIQNHRRGIVRHEARRTHLARMFLRGTPYKSAESFVYPSNKLNESDWDAIYRMACRYARYDFENGPFKNHQDVAQKFEEWRQT